MTLSMLELEGAAGGSRFPLGGGASCRALPDAAFRDGFLEHDAARIRLCARPFEALAGGTGARGACGADAGLSRQGVKHGG